MRTNDLGQVPKTAAIISLLPFSTSLQAQSLFLLLILFLTDYDNSASPGLYVTYDSTGNIFYLVACSFAGDEIGSKIFVVRDTAVGISKLKEPELRYVGTGGVVEECETLALQATFPGY